LSYEIRSVKRRKLLQKIIDGSKNIRFSEMVNLVEGFGFELSRTDGSHHIFFRPDIPELVNLQNVKGQAKPYQIRQFLKLVEKHNLKLEEK
jgi:predicted RNA binding protein YcfA (HicA-like mRNA interferase family)